MRVKNAPRLPPRGFFCLKLVQPQDRPHPYRRGSPRECFAGCGKFVMKVGSERGSEKRSCSGAPCNALLQVNFLLNLEKSGDHLQSETSPNRRGSPCNPGPVPLYSGSLFGPVECDC